MERDGYKPLSDPPPWISGRRMSNLWNALGQYHPPDFFEPSTSNPYGRADLVHHGYPSSSHHLFQPNVVEDTRQGIAFPQEWSPIEGAHRMSHYLAEDNRKGVESWIQYPQDIWQPRDPQWHSNFAPFAEYPLVEVVGDRICVDGQWLQPVNHFESKEESDAKWYHIWNLNNERPAGLHQPELETIGTPRYPPPDEVKFHACFLANHPGVFTSDSARTPEEHDNARVISDGIWRHSSIRRSLGLPVSTIIKPGYPSPTNIQWSQSKPFGPDELPIISPEDYERWLHWPLTPPHSEMEAASSSPPSQRIQTKRISSRRSSASNHPSRRARHHY